MDAAICTSSLVGQNEHSKAEALLLMNSTRPGSSKQLSHTDNPCSNISDSSTGPAPIFVPVVALVLWTIEPLLWPTGRRPLGRSLV